MTLLNEIINEKTEEGQKDKPLNEMEEDVRIMLHKGVFPDLTAVARNLDNMPMSAHDDVRMVKDKVAKLVNKARQLIHNMQE